MTARDRSRIAADLSARWPQIFADTGRREIAVQLRTLVDPGGTPPAEQPEDAGASVSASQASVRLPLDDGLVTPRSVKPLAPAPRKAAAKAPAAKKAAVVKATAKRPAAKKPAPPKA
jgi:hypothetical protein